MITGFNSDIEHDGKVFHVQTEEKGLGNPVVVTLVYCGGEIVTSLEASYADLVGDDSAPEGEVRGRMNDQHQRLIQDILRGRFNPPQMPFGHDLISDRSLDELVLGYLEDSITERTEKVGRVLNKLGRFLSAAEQARIEREAPAAAIAVEDADEPLEVTGETLEATEIDLDTGAPTLEADPQLAVPTPERRRRKAVWIWAAVAAAIIAGVAGFFAIRSLGENLSTGNIEPPLPAPAVESNSATRDEGADRQAGVSVVTAAPSPTAEPPVEVQPEDRPLDGPPETIPSSPLLPRPTKGPVPLPEPETTAVEEQPPATPDSSTTSIPAEEVAPSVADAPSVAAAPPVVDEPIVEDEPIEALDQVDIPPLARQRDLPRYTRRARRLQQEGIVKLRIRIDSHGEVAEVVLIDRIPNSDLNDAAVEVASDWSFSPARKNGEQVAVWKDVEFEFTVRPDRTTSVRIRD